MPLWVQPLLRFRQEAMESNGLIQTRDSVEVTQYKAAEAAGTRIKVVPPSSEIYLRGTEYTAS